MHRFIIFLSLMASLAQGQQSPLQEQIYQAKAQVLPALVHINPVKSYYSSGERRHTVVTGSGFIFSRKGYVLTNHHVVENAEQVDCTLSNKKKLSARVIGSDPLTDVAVLQLNLTEADSGLAVARLGNSDSTKVGEIVLALGSPLGLSRSVSMGIISSIDRYFENSRNNDSPYNLWIQTDAAINPGNSGGPLINLQGEVIGINARGVFLAENLGFAIPINLARKMAEKFIRGEKIERSWIGVTFQPVKQVRAYLNQPDLQGVLVSDVDPLSPAKRAGLKAGDVIQTINNQPVHADFEENLPSVRRVVAELPLRTNIPVRFLRDGRTRTVYLQPQPDPFAYLPEFECSEWGLVVKVLNRHIFEVQALPDYHGVYISAVKNGEIAYAAGIRGGDVIREINDEPVSDMAAFKKIYTRLRKHHDRPVFLKLWRQGSLYFTVLKGEIPEESRQTRF